MSSRTLRPSRVTTVAAALAAVGALAVPVAPAVAAGSPRSTQPRSTEPRATEPRATEPRHEQGTLPDGSTWDIAVPAGWNGDVILFSHGFRTGAVNPTVDAGFAPTSAALQARGYAVAQSSYARTGWALGSAVDDQLGVLAEFKARIGEPRRTLAFGRSMGGLVSSLLAERRDADVDAAISTCGLLGGGLNLNNYQLDGQQAVASLLLPGEDVRLTKFASVEEAAASAQRLVDAVKAAQATPQGRARIALAASLMNMPTWATGATPPKARDAVAIEQAQYTYLIGSLTMMMTRRVDIQEVSGGDSGWNKGVDYARLLRRSDQAGNVARLYRSAGLDLKQDLRQITSDADVTADPAAVTWLKRTSAPTGRLRVPVLTMHTVADPAAPVEYTSEYATKVKRAGSGALLRQAYVQRTGHCTFTPAENVAAVQAMQERLDTGRWTGAVRPRSLQRVAEAANLAGAAFVSYRPGAFVNDRADRDPYGPRR
ncbi:MULTISPECIES: alpha/beta hydrolase family protein [Arsenicicoccus]|uniref:alpha/beta hydrolase family protein n=1 Tax=Arsenicicoccus TaxID=267408 RepID=UPI00257B5BA9|nr:MULTISPECIES: alpha/beta hydrolase [Arsenicicoccus]